ncbi:hypothetical protein DPX16_0602 [Anabarilius grahami]|uniref:Uncharacterized protein n=1 Tax=Anabarilius grahami TaxID=495550 RepID=A0A3N0Z4N9_ANAGA|nr:hypothetical protein DPX16_0602 [Anabarilius grahami]
MYLYPFRSGPKEKLAESKFHSCTPSALDLSVDHRPFGLARLPRYVGSTWVRHCFASAANLRNVRCSLVLHPFDYSLLRPTSGSDSALGHSSSDLRTTSSLSGGNCCSSVAATKIFAISTPPQFIGCTVGSILAIIVYSHPHGGPHQCSIMAPPSINAAVGHYPGCGLDKQPAAPAQGHWPSSPP